MALWRSRVPRSFFLRVALSGGTIFRYIMALSASFAASSRIRRHFSPQDSCWRELDAFPWRLNVHGTVLEA